jgi:uncharacterized membrane protein required for colicin V production
MSFVTGILLYISLSKYTIPLSDWMVTNWDLSYGWSTVISVVSQILLISVVTLLITKVIEILVSTLNLNIFNRILGALFGLLAMQFVITMFVILMGIANLDFVVKQIDQSKVCQISSHINSHYLKQVFGKDINGYLQEYLDKNREDV